MIQTDPFDGVLRDDRLHLQPLEPHHAESLFDGLQNPRLYDFIDDQPPITIEALRARYVRLARRRSPDGSEIWLNWAVWSADETRFIGYVQATVTPDERAVIAYVLFPDAWGKGYAKAAVTLMMSHLAAIRPNLDFHAYADVRNRRSIALLDALGFRRIAVRKDAGTIRGMASDEAEFSMVRSCP